MFKDIYEELALKFSDLSNLRPSNAKSHTQMFNSEMSDKIVQGFNPERYAFYMEFMKAIQNPEVLKSVIYENKLIKSKNFEQSKIIESIASKMNKLFAVKYDNIGENDYIDKKNKQIKDVKDEINKKLTFVLNQNNITTENKPYEKLLGIFKGGNNPSQDADTVKQTVNEFYNSNKLRNYSTNLDNILKKDNINPNVKASMFQDMKQEIEDDVQYSIRHLDLTKEDKLVFIGITFMIRLLTLMIIDWSLTSNFIVNFHQAYILYISLYLIFILLIMAVVNMFYVMPIQKLYTDSHDFATTVASILYFFYLVPGKMIDSAKKILAHLALIIVLTIVALFIVQNNPQNEETTISYDYSEKKNIRRQLSNFTLLLWILTSVVAMNAKI